MSVPEEADALTQIALSAKAHWGYPERWMEIWTPQLTFSPEYFDENESWVQKLIMKSQLHFYTLQDEDGNAWIENLWVLPEYMGQGVGKRLFLHATDLAPASWDTKSCNSKQTRTPSVFMRKWA